MALGSTQNIIVEIDFRTHVNLYYKPTYIEIYSITIMGSFSIV